MSIRTYVAEWLWVRALRFAHGTPVAIDGVSLFGDEPTLCDAADALARISCEDPLLYSFLNQEKPIIWTGSKYDFQAGRVLGVGRGFQAWRCDGFTCFLVQLAVRRKHLGKAIFGGMKFNSKTPRYNVIMSECFNWLVARGIPDDLSEMFRVDE
jgi:hypothetical protein